MFVWNQSAYRGLTPLVLSLEYSRRIMSTAWLMMLSLIALPGHQQPCQQSSRINGARRESQYNKANLRDLIAATGLVILLKFDPNHRFFSPCDLEIWWMTSKNFRAHFLYYIKLCASFQSHGWIQTGVTVRKRSIRVQIGNFLSRLTLKFDRWPWKTIGHIFYLASSFVHHFIAIGQFKLELQSGNAHFGSKSMFFCPVWPWNFTDYLDKW